MYLGKINTDGVIQWLQEAGAASGYTGSNGIDIDKAGNAYITGYYRGAINFGPIVLTGPSGLSYDIFIAKCNAAGEYVWVNKAFGPGTTDNGSAVSIDEAGNCYFVGTFGLSMTFGATTLTSSGAPDVYVAKTDSLGTFLWATQCGGDLSVGIAGIRANAMGIFVTGDFQGTSNFGPSLSLTPDSTTTNVYVARIKGYASESAPATFAPAFSVFPNPANDVIRLRGFSSAASYIIQDAVGKTVQQGPVNTTGNINVSNLKSGAYVVSLIGDANGLVSRPVKFVKN